MATTSHSTPLIALESVVLDSETTGLDAKTARIIQIAALKMCGTSIETCATLERIINPGVPIPPASTAVHGLSDADVAKSPAFRDVAGEIMAYVGPRIIIGHSIGYDLAILRREHELAGLPWRQPPSLCIRVLARLVAPTLADHSLDRLAEWLGIRIEGRHTAMGDTRATAEVFAALVPLLRQGGIRTLAEAQAASTRLFEDEARQSGGLAAEAKTAGFETPRPLVRIDSFPYRHKVRDVMSAPALWVSPETSVGALISLLLERKVSSVFVRSASGEHGIVTERDALRAIDAKGAAGLATPVGEIMITPLQSVSADAFVYRAIGRMTRMGFRHLAVRDVNNEIIGAVTTRNLLRHRGTTAIVLGDQIDSAEDVATLGSAWAKVPLMARSLLDEDVDPRTVAGVISSEICALTRRAAKLAEAQMAKAGKGPPPTRYAVLVLGSAGRGESLLAADQDNAIVYAEGAPGGSEDTWFAELATVMNDILDEIGIPLCKGGVMARNAQWRQSVDGWKETIRGWIGRQRPQDLLNVDIFFDGITAHGDVTLGDEIWAYAYEIGHKARDFLALLSLPARDRRAPLTLFGGIRTENGRIDLKKNGVLPIFTGARVLSIRHDVRTRATPDRLRGLLSRDVASENDIESVIAAHRTILGAMLGQQLIDVETGVPLSTKVDISRFSKAERADLKEALEAVDTIGTLVGEGRV
ncbi:MAG: CBS domain-containing protein [Hyphomicrobiaceae bacterium]|nr:CBS domain-containing protein [Hyphomicrobiaceae bacterium]